MVSYGFQPFVGSFASKHLLGVVCFSHATRGYRAVVSARSILEVVLLETWIRGDGKLRAKPSRTGKIHPKVRKQWRFIARKICIFLVCWKCLGQTARQTARIEHGKGFSALDDILQYLVGGLEHEFYDFPYIGNNSPNWLIIFFRGGETTNQTWSS